MENSTRLPRSLQRLADGLKAGAGPTSQRSPLTRVGESPALLPIVVSRSRGSGLKRFLTTLGTMSALREGSTGERILTLSLDLDAAAFLSLIEPSEKRGAMAEISLDLSFPTEPLSGTSASTWSKRQTFGISVDHCDHCDQPIQPRQAYVAFTDPVADSLRLVHRACIAKVDYF